MPGERARSALRTGTVSRFADVRWVPETGSTNADVARLGLEGAPEGLVVVADHQTAGRGRAGRSWVAPPGASLLLSVLLRPPSDAADACTMAMGLAAVAAVEEVAGFSPRLKWPNDLVWPGDGVADDRKLAGILAESHWPPAGSPTGPIVVVGIGINVDWPQPPPAELADIAIACNHIAGRAPDREDLLVALLRSFETRYALVLQGERSALLEEWRSCSATLGREVHVERPDGELTGRAVDVTEHGHLVVQDAQGVQHTLAVGDVVHLRAHAT